MMRLLSFRMGLLLGGLLVLTLPGCDFVGGLTGGDDDEPREVELYPVLLDGSWGYINARGRITIEPQFDWAGAFKEGRARVYEQRRHGYIDESGDWVVEPRFEEARDFSGGYAAVRLDGRWGFIDQGGSFVINPQFTSAGDFYEGRAFLRDATSTWNYIDTKGQVIRSVDTPEMTKPEEPHFSAGLALVQDEDEARYGYINKNGQPVIPLQYASARAFSDGLAAVKVSDRWGYIDTKQKTVINPRYIEAGSFSEGLAPVRENTNTWGYADKSGRMSIEARFEDARPFSEGLAAVQELGLWGFVDTSGKVVVKPQFEDVSDFDNGLARIVVELPHPEQENQTITKYGYLDRSGAYVWYPTY